MNISPAAVSNKSFSVRRVAIAVLALAAAATLVPGAPRALVKFDFEQKYFNEPGQPVLDHCVIEKDGVYHLFYLRGDPAISIGHARTTDFIHWTLEAPVLSPGTWDNRAMWAPHVIKVPSAGYFMFYTGVNTAWAQQTGLAISSDLASWIKLSWPLYHPDPAWALWDEAEWSHGRDPHILEYGGTYYMFVTAKTKSGLGAVACATSNNLITWTDAGPMYVHDSWHVLESVFILVHNGKFHMFFTEETINGTSHMASDSLLTGWDPAARQLIDEGHAAQVTTLSDGREIFSRHSVYNDNHGGLLYNLRFDDLMWVGDIPAPYKPWALADNWTLVWGNAFAYQPVFLNNPAVRGENVAATYKGNCWLGTYERYTGPMGFGFPGSFQGDSRTGVLRSRTFTITGKSMNLLVGGGNDPANLYVALVKASTGKVLYKETGRGTDEMDLREWDLAPYKGVQAFIEIADLSTDVFGHINCDEITESYDPVGLIDGEGADGKKTKDTGLEHAPDDQNASARLVLHQNSPNPFNPATTLSYELPNNGHVSLRVYDVSGKLTRTLVDRVEPAGTHSVPWNGRDDTGAAVVSGIYFYRLTFEGAVVDTRKMLLLK